MNNLNLGLIAADAYFKEGEHRADQQRQAQRFDWEKQRAESELSTLPEQTEARRAQFQDQAGAAQADMDLRPGTVENAKKQQKVTGYGLDRASARQPAAEDAADAQANINSGLLGAKAQDLPKLIAQQRQQGVLDQVAAGQAALKGLGQLIDAGDNNAVVQYMNDIDAVSPDPNNRFHAPVAQVGFMPNPQDPSDKIFVALDANGQPVRQVSMSRLRQIVDGPGTPEKLKPGETVGRLDARGNFVPSYTAPETNASKRGGMGPLERDVDYLTGNHGMTKQQALDYLHSAKTQTRQDWILRTVQGMGRTPKQSDIDNLGQIYDRIAGGGQAAPAASGEPQQSPVPAPQGAQSIYGLMGIPAPR